MTTPYTLVKYTRMKRDAYGRFFPEDRMVEDLNSDKDVPCVTIQSHPKTPTRSASLQDFHERLSRQRHRVFLWHLYYHYLVGMGLLAATGAVKWYPELSLGRFVYAVATSFVGMCFANFAGSNVTTSDDEDR